MSLRKVLAGTMMVGCSTWLSISCAISTDEPGEEYDTEEELGTVQQELGNCQTEGCPSQYQCCVTGSPGQSICVYNGDPEHCGSCSNDCTAQPSDQTCWRDLTLGWRCGCTNNSHCAAFEYCNTTTKYCDYIP